MANASTIFSRSSGALDMPLPTCDGGRLIVRVSPNVSDWGGYFQAYLNQYAMDGVYNPAAPSPVLDQSFGSSNGSGGITTSLELVVELDDLRWPNNDLSVGWVWNGTSSIQEPPLNLQVSAWFVWSS